MLQQLAVYEKTPSRSAMHHEMRLAVQNAVAALPTTQRLAIQHHYIQGASADDTARLLNRTPAAVWMLCSRALKSLHASLSPHDPHQTKSAN